MSDENPASDHESLDSGVILPGLVAGQRCFDRYVLQGILGCGGMGVVWLAWDEKLDQHVALKFLPDVLRLDATAADDLKRETRRSLQLTHPNILRIYDYVYDATAAAISMEYVDGPTLAVLQLHRPNRILSLLELSPLVKQICEALDYAHQRAKVVHRDLKPANLMITQGGELKVADFGISSSICDSMTGLTNKKVASGTLGFMSPQQARGRRASVSDDIYALGSTLYALLTSRPPFFQGEVYQQLLHELPLPIAVRREELGIQGEPIPEEWEAVIAACLSKDPAQRPRSAGEVQQILEGGGFTAGASGGIGSAPEVSPLSLEPESPLNRSRPSGIWIALGLTMLFLAASGMVAYRFVHSHRATREVAESVPPITSSPPLPVAQTAPAAIIPPSPPPAAATLAAAAVLMPASSPPALAPKGDQDASSSAPVTSSIPVAKSTQPWIPTTITPAAESGPRAGQIWTNSLGMTFKPVPGTNVLFSQYDTRVQDFRTFATETGYRQTGGIEIVTLKLVDGVYVTRAQKFPNASWENPGFRQTEDHPVVGVNWNEAHTFCEWLTLKDRSAGKLSASQSYRLPTDTEWTTAAGGGKYPWGEAWPPPKGAGNFRDESCVANFSGAIIAHLPGNDGYPRTSPVGAFAANPYGLYDLTGNVSQWCEDWYVISMNEQIVHQPYATYYRNLLDDRGGHAFRVQRGGSWMDCVKYLLEVSFHRKGQPDYRSDSVGFRVVLEY